MKLVAGSCAIPCRNGSGARGSPAGRGEPVDVTRHRPAVEAKGATYTALSVAGNADGAWVAQCVVDV